MGDDDDVGAPHAQLADEVAFDLLHCAAVVFAVEGGEQILGFEGEIGGGEWESPGCVGGCGAGEEEGFAGALPGR